MKQLKPLKGKLVPDSTFNREILAILEDVESASPGEVAEKLGAPWTDRECREALNVRMNDLARGKRGIVRQGRGRYVRDLPKTVDRNHLFELAVLKAMRDLGGIARYRELRAEFGASFNDIDPPPDGVTRWEHVRNTANWRKLQKGVRRLVRSGELRRDYSNNAMGDYTRGECEEGFAVTGSDGIYNLPRHEMDHCVQRGAWILHRFEYEKPGHDKEELRDMRDERLVAVATAFRAARETARYSIEEMIADAAVADAIREWDVLYERGLIQAEAAEWQRRGLIARAWQHRLYERFELFPGRYCDFPDSTFRSMGGHLGAPAAFYHAVATKLGVDAVALSRGKIASV